MHTNPNWKTDTFYFNVQQIFLNQGNPVDSVIMYFHVKTKYMSELEWSRHDTISIDNTSGCVRNRSCGGYNYFRITPETVVEYGSIGEPKWTTNNLNYVGYK